MNRVAMVFLGGFLGAVLGVTALTLFIKLSYPNYIQDSGSPPILPGLFLGCPGGLVFGLLVGAFWPIKSK